MFEIVAYSWLVGSLKRNPLRTRNTNALQLRNNNSEVIGLYHSSDNFTNFEQDKQFLLLILLISLSSNLSFGLAFYSNTILIYKPCL